MNSTIMYQNLKVLVIRRRNYGNEGKRIDRKIEERIIILNKVVSDMASLSCMSNG